METFITIVVMCMLCNIEYKEKDDSSTAGWALLLLFITLFL